MVPLRAEDSIVPIITAGFEDQPSITDLAPLARRHFGLPVPVRQAASALAHVG